MLRHQVHSKDDSGYPILEERAPTERALISNEVQTSRMAVDVRIRRSSCARRTNAEGIAEALL